MPQYNKDDDYIKEDTIKTRENERYFNPFKSIPLYRIYQMITLTASAAHTIIQDAPRAMVVGATAITTYISHCSHKKRKQKISQAQTKPKTLEDSLNSS